MTLIDLGFSFWAHPNKKTQKQHCSWGGCGLFAHSIGKTVTIYSDMYGTPLPLQVLPPFDSDVTALAWFDSSGHFLFSFPFLLVATFSGRLCLYDISERKCVDTFHRKSDHFTCLVWSPFSVSTFFGGTSGGNFICYEMHLSEIVKSRVVWELKLPQRITFIVLDPLTGSSCVVGTKRCSFTVFDAVHSEAPVARLSCDTKNEVIACCHFPASPDCLLIATCDGVDVFLTVEQVSVPFLTLPNVELIGITAGRGNRALIVRGSSVELFDVSADPRLLSTVSLSGARLPTACEIACFDVRNDTVSIVTRGGWLTVVVMRRDRLFVSKRVRLLNGAPCDWSFTHEQIAVVTKDGCVLIAGRPPRATLPRTPSAPPKRVVLPPIPAAAPAAIVRPPLSGAGARGARPLAAVENSEPLPAFPFPKGRSTPSLHDFADLRHVLPTGEDSEPRITRTLSGRPAGLAGLDPPWARRTELRRMERRRGSEGPAFEHADVVRALAARTRARTPAEAEPTAPPLPMSVAVPAARPPKRECGVAHAIVAALHLTDAPLRHVEWIGMSRLIAWSADGGQNAIFVVDLKTRRVRQLMPMLKHAEVPITAVVFSADRQLFCVIVGGKSITFFRAGPPARQIAVFLYQIPVVVDFRTGADAALIVAENGRMSTVVGLGPDGEPRRVGHFLFPGRARDSVTAVAVRGNAVFVGTASGAIVQADVSAHPFTVKEIKQLKSGPATIVCCPRGGFLAQDPNGAGFFSAGNGEWSSMPCAVKTAVLCTPIAFLCRVRGEHWLRVVQVVGQFAPIRTAAEAACPAMKSRAEREADVVLQERTRETCVEWGMPLALRILQTKEAPQWAREQVQVLRHVFMRLPQLVVRAGRYSCLLRDCESARQLFLGSDPTGSDFVSNILKAVVIRLGPGDQNALKRAASQLLVNGMTHEAIDLLLLTGNWDAAASNLITLGMLTEAALVCRVQDPSHERTQLMERLAVRMLVSDMTAYSFIVMSQIGDFDQIADRFREMSENGQAAFLAHLGWE
jgi:hypothetical protein